MGKLSDILDHLAESGGEYPETMLDDIRAAAEADTAELQAGWDAETAIRVEADANTAAAIAEHEATITALRSRNYELLTATAASDNAGGGVNDDDAVDGLDNDVVEDPTQTTFDDVFTERD